MAKNTSSYRQSSRNAGKKRPIEMDSNFGPKTKKIRKTKSSRSPCSWTEEEDNELRKIMKKCDETDSAVWVKAAAKLSTERSGKQVRERWVNHLHPGLKKSPWTEREIEQVLKLQKKLGNCWAAIASKIPGRSDNDVKNKYNSLMRSKLRAGQVTGRSSNSGKTKKSKNTMTTKKSSGASSSRSSSSSSKSLISKGKDKAAKGKENRLKPKIKGLLPKVFSRREENGYDTSSVTSEEFDSELEPTPRLTEYEEEEEEEEIMQSESQVLWGERIKEYKWRLEQERKIEMFRRGKMDCGLTCADVNRLKLMGLGLGIKALNQQWFGSSAETTTSAECASDTPPATTTGPNAGDGNGSNTF